jgi:hypothetical protein
MICVWRRTGFIFALGLAACADSLARATAVDAGADGGTPVADGGAASDASDVSDGGVIFSGDAASCVGFHEAWASAGAWQAFGTAPPTPQTAENSVAIVVPAGSTAYLTHPLPPCSITITLSVTLSVDSNANGFEVLALRATDSAQDVGFFLAAGATTALAFPLATSRTVLPYTSGAPITLTLANDGTLTVTTGAVAEMITTTALREIDIGGISGPPASPGSKTFTYGAIDVTPTN